MTEILPRPLLSETVGHIGPSTVGTKSYIVGLAADPDLRHLGASRGVHHDGARGGLTGHPELAAIWGEGQVDRGLVLGLAADTDQHPILGVGDLFDGGVDVEGLAMGRLMATGTDFGRGLLETRPPGCRRIEHDRLAQVFRSRPVAAFALDPVAGIKSRREALLLETGAVDMTAQTLTTRLGVAVHPDIRRQLASQGGRQAGIGPGMGSHPPSAELEAHVGTGVAGGTGHDTHKSLAALVHRPVLPRARRFNRGLVGSGVEDGLERAVELPGGRFQHDFVRSLGAMADHAGLPVRHDQTAPHRQLAVLHHLGGDILAAGTMTGLALDAVLDEKGLVSSPLLGIGTGGVATETDSGL
jgi:hypothetical protein